MSFTHVIHAATESAKGPQTPPLLLFQQIIDGAQNILELAVQTGASRILLTSSGAVYGPQPPEINALAEDYAGSPDLTSPASAYGMGKRAAEHLCHLYHHTYSLEPVIARCFAFIGQDLPLQAHYAIGNFLHNAIYGDYIRIEGDGAPLRTYMHQDDLAKWLIRLLEDGKAGEAYNVGSDEVTTINDLAHLVRDMIAPEKAIRILGKQAQTITRNIYVPSIDKAQRTLGLKIELPLELAIQKTHESLRSTLAVLRP